MEYSISSNLSIFEELSQPGDAPIKLPVPKKTHISKTPFTFTYLFVLHFLRKEPKGAFSFLFHSLHGFRLKITLLLDFLNAECSFRVFNLYLLCLKRQCIVYRALTRI